MEQLSLGATARMRGVRATGILGPALLLGCATDGMSKYLSKPDRARSAIKMQSASSSASRPYALRYFGGPHGLAWQVRD
jgi:hypothetical protein